MSNDHSEPPKAAPQATQGPKASLRVYRENNTDMNQTQPSNPPETPTPPPNGGVCASEPMTLPERHQTALRHIHSLEIHNAKLYEDNCRLVNAVNLLNDRLAFLGVPQNTQVQRFADLQERLRASEANRMSIDRKYQGLLQCIPAGSPTNHIMELQTTRDAYALLDREYRLLREKYVRLKAAVDTSRVAQQQSLGIGKYNHSLSETSAQKGIDLSSAQRVARGLFPAGGSEQFATARQFRAHDQNRNNPASPASVMSPGPHQPFLDQNGSHRRRSSESVATQPPLRPGPTPMAMAWLAPLPTPPPSGPISSAQTSPTGIPVHTPMHAGSLGFPYHPQMIDPRTVSELSPTTQSRHLVEQGAAEQLKTAAHLRQRGGGIAENANKEPVLSVEQVPVMASLSSPYLQKRPNTEFQNSLSPEGERKKPRIEGEADCSTTISADTRPANGILSPPASTDSHSDRKASASDSNVRSYEECVNLIFEKDADVENGVFCGLCLDRYEAKMIQEPPDVLVQPDFDFLVMHCKTMHPTVWEDLRRKA